MPNWANNYLEVIGKPDDVHNFRNSITSTKATEDGKDIEPYFDLTLLHPMPSILIGTRSPTPESPIPSDVIKNFMLEGKWTVEQYEDYALDLEIAYQQAQIAFEQTGYYDWYTWAHVNWGTKWAPREVYDNDFHMLADGELGVQEFTFDTAWSPPMNLMNHIAEQNPHLIFILSYREESMMFTGTTAWFTNNEGLQMLEQVYECGSNMPLDLQTRWDAAMAKNDELSSDDWDAVADHYQALNDIDCELAEVARRDVLNCLRSEFSISV